MRQEEHVKRTKGKGKEIHQFIDQYYAIYGTDHRVVLHHALGVKLIGEKFGAKAIPIAEQHIRDDWGVKDIPQDHLDQNFYRVAWCSNLHNFIDALKFAEELYGRK
jgi:hypothetical protein